MSCSRFRGGVVVWVAFAVLDGAGCAPPPEDEGLEGPLLEAPGGAFVDVECNDKHRRFPIKSFSSGGVKYTRQGDNERFERDGRCNRLEIDTNDHYKSGSHEFEGDVRIGDVSGQSVVQIFDASSSGPIMMVKAYSSGGGTLRKLAGSATLATGIKGEWVRLRIVHDLGANTLTIYVNGDRKWSGSGGRGGGFNLKYGNYGTGASDVQWRGVSW